LADNEVPGLAAAVQGLAADYARLITTTSVVSATEAQLGSSSLPGSLSASPVPESSIIDVEATAPSKAVALRLANAGAAALTQVVTTDTDDTQAQLNAIMAEYQKADGTAEKATSQAGLLQSELSSLVSAVGKSGATSFQLAEENTLTAQIAKLETQADAARLQASAYMTEYDAAIPPLQVQQEMVQPVGLATYSGSNRKSYLEAGGLGGLVGGLIVGLAAAAWLDNRRGRRGAVNFAK
jgi:hypothetical protein